MVLQLFVSGTHWVFNPKIKEIILTQDITFLQKSYVDYNIIEKPFLITLSHEGSDDKEELKPVSIFNQNNNN